MKSKRVYVEVRWDKKARSWFVRDRATKRTVRLGGLALNLFSFKTVAIAAAGEYCKAHRPSERVVYNKNGRIAKGNIGRSTFGADPEKTRG